MSDDERRPGVDEVLPADRAADGGTEATESALTTPEDARGAAESVDAVAAAADDAVSADAPGGAGAVSVDGWAGDAAPASEPGPVPPAAAGPPADVPHEDSAAPEPGGTPAPADRWTDLALARLHLRTGALSLARAELEAAAGRGALDAPSLVALAEARWRTGDLAGAGEAAQAAITQAADDPLAYVIAAEAIAALGRRAEASRLANAAVDRLETSLDVLFAGMPRSLIWPEDAPPTDALPGGAADEPRDDGSPAPAAAAEAFAGGRAALAAGDAPLAALRLSLAIRLDPRFASGVLTAIGDRGSAPLLALVAGDALRLLGREEEALEAYERARGRPVPEAFGGAEPPDGATEDPAPDAPPA